MVSSGTLRRVALVRTNVSEELSVSFIRVTRIGELETTLAVTSNRRTDARCEQIPSHRRENLKSYMYSVKFEVFTALIMKNGVLWDVTPCRSCRYRRFGGTWRLLHQGDKNR
jgi:hypothetical protein